MLILCRATVPGTQFCVFTAGTLVCKPPSPKSVCRPPLGLSVRGTGKAVSLAGKMVNTDHRDKLVEQHGNGPVDLRSY